MPEPKVCIVTMTLYYSLHRLNFKNQVTLLSLVLLRYIFVVNCIVIDQAIADKSHFAHCQIGGDILEI